MESQKRKRDDDTEPGRDATAVPVPLFRPENDQQVSPQKSQNDQRSLTCEGPPHCKLRGKAEDDSLPVLPQRPENDQQVSPQKLQNDQRSFTCEGAPHCEPRGKAEDDSLPVPPQRPENDQQISPQKPEIHQHSLSCEGPPHCEPSGKAEDDSLPLPPQRPENDQQIPEIDQHSLSCENPPHCEPGGKAEDDSVLVPCQKSENDQHTSSCEGPPQSKSREKGAADEITASSSSSAASAPKSEPVCNVVADHYNNIPNAGIGARSRSRILHLRNFNNWIKSMLINEYLEKLKTSNPEGCLKVLDIGCGKGGDLQKWRLGKINHLVCADIAVTSIDQCKERYQEMKQRTLNERLMQPLFSAEFIVANCTKERLLDKYEDAAVKFDLVSCQFAFHYCFESLPQAECMLRNASECLRTGGYFFGSCPDANSIISRVRKAGGKKFGNDLYSVEFDSSIDNEKPPPLFGTKYNYYLEGVVNCPEFLVYFPAFVRLASRFGLKLVIREQFRSFYDRMKEKGRKLLGKMQSLETYPPFTNQDLMGPLSDYQHADDFIKKTGSQRKLGTLSQAEWEAVTLYVIFVFEKVSD